MLSDLWLPMVEVRCTTDGVNNNANVTWELKSLENQTQDYIVKNHISRKFE